jgi:hypothetical protein
MYDVDCMTLWKYPYPPSRRGMLAMGLTAAVIGLAMTSIAVGSAAAPRERATAASEEAVLAPAHAARLLVVNDTAHMTITNPSSASATLVEEGRATGSLAGTVRARLAVGASSVTAGFTIYLKGGTISGHSTAHLNPGKGEYASFGGSLGVSHGSGRYAHAAGSGSLYGTINRNTDNATVQVVGNLHY